MAETIEQFVYRRRRELDAEIARLQVALAAARAERERVETVASTIGASTQQIAPIDLPVETLVERPKRSPETTIKAMVRNVLAPPSGGMSAIDILAAINHGRDEPFARTSLSPQLSRLKAAGEIHREGRIWKLGPGPGTADVSDDE